MKNVLNTRAILGLTIVSMILISCAQSDKVVTNNLIQKRKYNKGFFIDFKKNNKEALAVKTSEDTPEEVVVATEEKVARNTEVFASNTTATDDNIIIEENTATVNAIENERTTAPTKTAVAENVVASKKVQRVVNRVNKVVQKQNKKLEKKKSSKSASGKSQVVALILVLLVGGIGIHRFYLGYTWQGIVQLLTLGACGIWSLIDLIRIITGDLGPKDGRYSKTL